MFDYKNACFYQIWPRSFMDSNNDGIGDLQGIISKLDYLKTLGINCIWLSPVYDTNNDDYGYDIKDYYTINPEYGNMQDLENLIEQCNLRGIQIFMDLVANHTSTDHKWFKEALRDPNSKYRDFYFFKETNDNSLPNNWLSFFGGSVWQKDPSKNNSYFLATFAPTQADLNWDNVNVRLEIYKIMAFYLEKGIAGFRMDVINTIDKKQGLPSYHPELKGLQFPKEYIIDGAKVHEYLKEMRKLVLDKYDACGLAEGCLVSLDNAMKYTSEQSKELQMTFHFDLAMLGYGELGKYDCRKLYQYSIMDIKKITRKWQNAMIEYNGYIGNYLSNHDHKRHLGRFTDVKKYHAEGAKAFALYNFTLMGSPFIYQGEEIGMTNLKIPYKEWKDYEAINSVKTMHDMLHIPNTLCRLIGSFVTRDNARTPMQWNNSQYAGFSQHQPWIMLNPNYERINVKNNLEDQNSIFYFYQKLIKLRHDFPVLVNGIFKEYNLQHPKVICFTRSNDNQSLLMIINLSKHKTSITLEYNFIGTYLFGSEEIPLQQTMKLKPYQALIYKIK